MPDRRRFSDSMPALDDITNSDWDLLNGEQRSDLLRRRHAQVIDVLRLTVDGVHEIAAKLSDDLGPLLAANTAATARTEAKVDANVKSHAEMAEKLQILVERSASALALWDDVRGTRGLLGRFGSFCKDTAPFVVIGAIVYGGWQAFTAWVQAGFPGLK